MPALLAWAFGGAAVGFGAGLFAGVKTSELIKWGVVGGVAYWYLKGR